MRPDGACETREVCCRLDPPVLTTNTDCPPGLEAPFELCRQTDVCCRLPDGSVADATSEKCTTIGGLVVPDESCVDVCCVKEGGEPFVTDLGDCDQFGSAVVAIDQCDGPQTQVWQANYTLDANVDCELEPYLVVPSSGASQLAVYNTDTLTPLPTTPFDTCSNPSRIMMDANTDVYASCRGDGRINKHTRDGVLLWSTQLSECSGARGIALSGDGRLFAGCSHPTGVVVEMDPLTGAELQSIAIGHQVYGVAIDSDGLYVSGFYQAKVSKVFIDGPTMAMAWTVTAGVYGITADNQGRVWIGGSNSLRALSSADGSVVVNVPNQVTVGGTTSQKAILGLMVGLDGNIYSATYSNLFTKYDPLADTMTGYALHPGALGNRGITLDADHDVYSINLLSNDLTHTTPGGVSTAFGDDAGTTFLVSPYGYSGDMTGLMSTCIGGITDTWFSDTIDSGDPTTTWLTISWNATAPPGTNVQVFYSVDGGPFVLATNPENINVTGQTFQVKAILSTTDPANLPTLNNVTVTYQ